jgi:hypothetical protein
MGRITLARQLEIALAVFDRDERLRVVWAGVTIRNKPFSNDRWLR